MRSLPVLLVAVLAGCGGSNGVSDDGPLKLGVESGQNQTVTAGAAQLPAPVIGRLVHAQTASGFRFELVKTAYAQTGPTVVNGSPVVGALVCAVSPVAGSMVPFVPCANTDANGHATFYFDPGKKAGSQISEIRGILNGIPSVFDTARATVNPSAADPNFHTGPFAIVLSPDTVPANAVTDVYGNAVSFRVVADARMTVGDITAGTVAARTVAWQPAATDGNGTQYVAELRGADGSLVGHVRYSIGADHRMSVNSVAGVSLTP